MKMFNRYQFISRTGAMLLAGFAGMALAQNSGGVEKFEPGAFPGYVVEEVVVPVPSEIFAVLDKLGDPNWKDEVRPILTPDTTNRMELSLAFGIVVAEGFVAVQAQDKQSVEDIGREVLSIAKKLGLTNAVQPHAQSILDSVDKNNWKAVRREFDQTQATVRAEMERLRDNDLAQCVSLGGWLRGTASVTSVINKSYTLDRAELLNQPMLVEHFIKSVGGMSSGTKNKNSKLVNSISEGLRKIHKEMEGADGAFPAAKVKRISATSEELLTLMLKAKTAK